MTATSAGTYREVRDELLKRLREAAPGRVQILSGPRQVGKTTLLLELAKEFAERATYVSADSTEAQMPGWWEQVVRAAGERARKAGGGILLADEIPYMPDWARRLKSEADRIFRAKLPLHVVASGSSAIQLGKGAKETMAGRFERLRLFHWPAAELMRCFHLPADEAVSQFVTSGSYPGSQALLGQPDRWLAYLRDSIVEPAIGRDILNLETVRKPALLRQVYAVAVGHPAEVVSLQKLAGELAERGALETIAHYLQLLEEACLVAGMRKYSERTVRQRAAPPKLTVLNHGLLAATGLAPDRDRDPVRWGRWVENAVGAFAWNAGQTVRYWRAEPLEVDWVLDGSWGSWAIEVKTGAYRPQDSRGLLEFCRLHPRFQPLLLCNEGDEASGRDGGVRTQSWASFLMGGPGAESFLL
jgi:predicted AAA+ superfamily ATPase